MSVYPVIEPDIEVTPLPCETMKVQMKTFQMVPFPFHKGAKVVRVDYYYPDRKCGSIEQMKIMGRTLLKGEECFELQVRLMDLETGKILRKFWTDLFFVDRGTYAAQVMLVAHSHIGMGRVDEFEGMETPLILETGMRRETDYSQRCGDIVFDKGRAVSEVTGVVELKIGLSVWRCLRVIDTDTQKDRRRDVFEMFVNEDGREVLYRKYNGLRYIGGGSESAVRLPREEVEERFRRQREWWEKTAGAPEILYDGEVFRLHQVVIPDYVLGVI